MNRQQAIEKINAALIEAIRTTGNKGFSLSQQRVPVITGYLKSTGSSKDVDNGFELNYSAEYSSSVERGTDPGIRNIKSYRRKDGVRVKAYSYFSKGSAARHFIKDGLTNAFESDFSNNLDNELHKVFHKVVRA